MANTKLKMLYLTKFLREETDEEHPKTIQDMIAYLARCDIPAERKALYDDLDALRLYGMDIQTVKGKSFGYFLGERDFQLPEVKLLIDVVQSSPFLTQGKSRQLIGKLEKQTSRENAKSLRRQVYLMNRLRTGNETLYYTVDAINTAINAGKKLSFCYFSYAVDGGKTFHHDGARYLVNPVALCVEKYYYLIAYDSEKQEYRHYRVDRIAMQQVEDTPRDALPADFDLGAYVKTIFDMYSGESQSLHLRFASSLLNAVVDRFGADAHMRDLGDGSFDLYAPVEVGPTFFGWLFQFGSDAEILEPEAVRQQFTAHCRAVIEKY